MTGFLILALVGLTTAGANLLGCWGFGFSVKRLWPAVSRMLEGIGVGLAFFAFNLLTAAMFIVAIRRLTGKFVSVYIAQDISLLALSLVQGLIFQWWRELSQDRSTRPPAGQRNGSTRGQQRRPTPQGPR